MTKNIFDRKYSALEIVFKEGKGGVEGINSAYP